MPGATGTTQICIFAGFYRMGTLSGGQDRLGPHASLAGSSFMRSDSPYGVRLEESLHFSSAAVDTHGQWIYRNITKHQHRYSQLKSIERRGLLREIDQFPPTSGGANGGARVLGSNNASRDHSTAPSGRTVAAPTETTSTDGIAAERSGGAAIVPLYAFGADDNLAAFSAKRQHAALGGSGSAKDKSNKRLRKPD
eukprot:scaffold41346_cov46-Cyclotella_meneghiniana.AAC.1